MVRDLELNELDRISIQQISATGYHGVLAQERREGQLFVVDVTMFLDLSEAAETDELAHTADYAAAADLIVAAIEGEPLNLIESLASRIAAEILGLAVVVAVEVTVCKPNAPLPHEIENVAVTIVRTR